MVIQVNNLERLINKLDKMRKLDYVPAITEATRYVQSKIKEPRAQGGLVPVDTGALQGSIRTKILTNPGSNEVSGIIFTSLEYAPYVEFGTSRMVPQPFMRPGIDQNRKQVNEIIVKHINEQLQQIANSNG